MGKKESYTFEDWLNGKSINWIQVYMKQGYEYTPEQEAVRRQIKKAQKRAWDWLIELNAEIWINQIKDNPEGYIEAFIMKQQKFFNDNLDLVLMYERGRIEGMDCKMYKKLKGLIEKHHKKGGYYIGVTIRKNGKGHPSRLQDVYVFKKVLKYLEENDLNSPIKKVDKRVKHGERDAIIQYWQESKATYLTDKYKFKSSGYYNQSKIAGDIKKDGGFSSSPKLIIDYTNLKDL